MKSVSPMREFHNNCSTDRLTSKRWRRRLITAFGLMLLLPNLALAHEQIKFVGTAISTGAGSKGWLNPTNVTADDGVHSILSAKIKNGGTTTQLFATMSGNEFTLPAGAIIKGITVTIETIDIQNGGGEDLEIFIIKGGATIGTNQDRGCSQPGCWPQALSTITWGGAANLWGTTWTDADINASDFGVSIRAESPNNAFFLPEIDYVQITITYDAFVDPTADAARAGAAVTTPANAYTSDDTYAVFPDTAEHDYKTFNFTIPAGATIDGIEVRVEWHTTQASDTGFLTLQLIDDAGVQIGSSKTTPTIGGTTDVIHILGSATDLWGAALTEPMVNDVEFGVSILYTKTAGGAGNNAYLDNVDIEVHYTVSNPKIVSWQEIEPS